MRAPRQVIAISSRQVVVLCVVQQIETYCFSTVFHDADAKDVDKDENKWHFYVRKLQNNCFCVCVCKDWLSYENYVLVCCFAQVLVRTTGIMASAVPQVTKELSPVTCGIINW